VVEGVVGSPGEKRSHHRALLPERCDADIVALFEDRSEGWERYVCSPTRFWRSCASASADTNSTRLRWLNSGCATNTFYRIVGANDGRSDPAPSLQCRRGYGQFHQVRDGSMRGGEPL
jgi:hypothetical protein